MYNYLIFEIFFTFEIINHIIYLKLNFLITEITELLNYSEAAFEAMMQILKEVNDFYDNASETKHQSMTVEDLALGFIDVANETMCRAIKSVTQV